VEQKSVAHRIVYYILTFLFCNVIINCLAGGNSTGGSVLEDDGKRGNPD
jgi:hypothetical protein